MKKERPLKVIYILISIALLAMLFFQGYLLNRQYQLLKAKVYELVLNNFNELNNYFDLSLINQQMFVTRVFVDKDTINDNVTLHSKNPTKIINAPFFSAKSSNEQISKDTVIAVSLKDFNNSLDDLNIDPTKIKKIDIGKSKNELCDTCIESATDISLLLTLDIQSYREKMVDLYNRLDTILPKLYKDYSDIFTYEFAVSDISGDSAAYFRGNFVSLPEEPFFQKGIGKRDPVFFHLFATMKTSYWLKHILIGVIISLVLVLSIFYLFHKLMKIIDSQKRLDSMKTDFINNMTHEFKTPIATVALALESIQHFGVRNQPQKMDEYLDIAQGELKKVNGMIEKVLNISKDSTFKLKLISTYLPILIKESVDQMKTIAESHHAIVNIETIGEIPTIKVDPFHLNNVFINLLDNSFKYKREDPIIHIRIESNQQNIEIQFSDNGKGISEKYLSFIFDNFFRVPTGNIHNVKGFGVGLSYVSKIISEHGGQISVSSVVDSYTTFKITLPIK